MTINSCFSNGSFVMNKPNTVAVKTFPPISSLTSVNVLAKKSLNNDSNRIQAQKARKHIEEIS